MRDNNADFNINLNSEEHKITEENVKKDDIIAKNFPDWDLIPPYQTVRRINRK